MLNFNDPRGLDPFTTKAFSSGDEQQFSDRYFTAFPINWQVQSSAHALLLNEAGLLVYGGASMEYVLNAYTKTFGGASMEYILGGIVDADFSSILNISGAFVGLRESNAAFTSQINLSSSSAAQVEVDVTFASVLTFTSLFPAERTSEAAFVSILNLLSEMLPDDPDIDVWVFTLGGETTPVSRYDNFRFNSFASVEGHYYAASDGGIVELTGNDDAGVVINAHIVTPRRAQGVDRQTRMPLVYLAGRSEGLLHCGVIDEAGITHDYTAELALGARDARTRVKLGKGLSASFWQLRIANESGQDFELTGIGTLPDVRKRRVR